MRCVQSRKAQRSKVKVASGELQTSRYPAILVFAWCPIKLPVCLVLLSRAFHPLPLPLLALQTEKIAFALLARCSSSLLLSCALFVTSTVVCCSISALASSLFSVYSSRPSFRFSHCCLVGTKWTAVASLRWSPVTLNIGLL
jgi:hypothetical protein